MEIRGYRVFYIDRREGMDYIKSVIRTTTADKLALVIRSFELLSGDDNLAEIKKYAGRYNKNLVLINPDPRLSAVIKEYGLYVFPDLKSLQENVPLNSVAVSSEEVNDENERGYLQKFLSLVGIILIFFLAWVYFYYPTATITIRPEVVYQNEQITVTGALNLQKINWQENIIPLHRFEVTITDNYEIETSGRKVTGVKAATGTVKFISERKEAVSITAGTTLETGDGIRFKTLENVDIPGLKVDYLMEVPVGMKAGQAEVKIEAINKGETGNVGTGQIRNIQNELDRIYVINPEPTYGGLNEERPVVSKDDLEIVRNNLDEQMKSKLLNKIYQKLGGNYRLIEDEIKYSVVKYSFNHEPGDVASSVVGTATLNASGFLVRNNELDRIVTRMVTQKLQDKGRLLSTGVDVQEIKLEDKGNNLYNIIMKLVTPVVPEIATSDIARKLAGNGIDAAREILSATTNIKDFEIETESEVLPRLSYAIKVVVNQPESYGVFNLNGG